MTPEEYPRDGQGSRPRRPYEPPAVRDRTCIHPECAAFLAVLVACAPGKLPISGTQACNAVQFT